MFVKKINKHNNSGKIYTYYRLCESVRIGDKTRHHNLLNLGTLINLDSSLHKALANRIEQLYTGSNPMFVEVNKEIEVLAIKFAKELRAKRKSATGGEHFSKGPNMDSQLLDLEVIDINSIEYDEVREIGAEWLCLQAIEELGIESFLKSENWNEQAINKALTLIISRAVYPASEYRTSQWIALNSAVSELVYKEHRHISHQQLYNTGDNLYELSEKIGTHLSTRTNDLFNLSDKIIFYDLTNTYFEGRKVYSELAQFGHSKEKRSDAKLVSLALVVNAEGFVKYSKIYEGNIFEAHTLCALVENLSHNSNAIKPVVVIDAGIATEENLLMLKEKGYDYLCVTRSKLKDFNIVDPQTAPIEIIDSRKNKIHIQHISKSGCTDQYLYIRSEKKALKEASMEAHYSTRYEQELDSLSKSIHRKGGTKKAQKVYERIGRIKQRYPTANKHYNIQTQEKDGMVIHISYTKNQLPQPKETHGVYFLRTTLKQNDEKTLWTIYNTLTAIEATFRTLKTDLNIRPVYHQKDDRTSAHIHLGVLAYMLVNTIQHKLKLNGINHSWSNIVRIMNTQKVVTSSFKNDKNKVTILKKCSQANSEVTRIYNALNYKKYPFNQKKYVVPQL